MKGEWPMRLLVCGGREFSNFVAMETCLDAIHLGNRGPVELVIHGAARGADTMAGQWALRRGIACTAYEADWAHEGRAAGPIRNKRMLDEGIPDLVVAFPGGRGTANMVRQARERGFEILEVA
jgi:hypothetical protein